MSTVTVHLVSLERVGAIVIDNFECHLSFLQHSIDCEDPIFLLYFLTFYHLWTAGISFANCLSLIYRILGQLVSIFTPETIEFILLYKAIYGKSKILTLNLIMKTKLLLKQNVLIMKMPGKLGKFKLVKGIL